MKVKVKWWYYAPLVVVIAAASVYFIPQVRAQAYDLTFISRCDTPLPYKIGSIDDRFGLSMADAKRDVNSAADIWEEVSNKNLFDEDGKAKLTVNFVYDARQELDRKISNLESELSEKNDDLSNEIAQYEKDSAVFEAKLEEFKSTVDRYNNEGGAPQDVYEKLKADQESLQKEANSLNQRAGELRLSTQNYNSGVGSLNQNIKQFNSVIEGRPEEGLYDPNENTISIYFVDNKPELVHTLAHELGHALSMDHIKDKNSIMYSFSTVNLTPTANDISELEFVCRKRPFPIILMEDLRVLLHERLAKK